ncbi:MAG: adenylate/guanylate cyclase domain-containing protein [Thermoleophilaceae bacterium]|jgi:adenylate cyclase
MAEADNGARGRFVGALKRFDANPRLIKAAQAARGILPGDASYGDPLSLGGNEPPQLIGQRIANLTNDRPSALRELGLSTLQVWQSLSEAQGRGRGDREMAVMFTDLVGFSGWALEAGDENALELLRCVGLAVEPCVTAHDGRIVKRLGDGIMAVFDDPTEAVCAALEAVASLREVEVAGHRPQIRAGVHVGKPRKLGGDYYGVDVNVAARVAAAARADEVLVSDPARQRLTDEGVRLQRRRFRAKGAPKDLKVFIAKRAA